MAFWIFKYNPKVYRLEALFDDPNPSIDWRVPQHSDRITIGDIAFIWRTGSRRGIVAVMTIDKAPEELEDSEHDSHGYVDPTSPEAKRIARKQPRAVGTLIQKNLDLRMEALRGVPGLEYLSAFEQTIATVFPVTASEGDILSRLADL